MIGATLVRIILIDLGLLPPKRNGTTQNRSNAMRKVFIEIELLVTAALK